MVRRLLYLNGIAILGVILFHAAGMGFTAMFSWSHRYLPESIPAVSQVGNVSYYGLRLIEQAMVFSLPAFLFVSGFFISVQAGRTNKVRWQAVLSRTKNLIIPYIIWSVIVMGLNFALDGRRYGLVDIGRNLLTGRSSPVLYFVPLLIQFYLLSPIFVRLARWNWKVLLVVTALLQLLVQLSAYPAYLGMDPAWSLPLMNSVPKWLFLARIFWFPLGLIIGFHSEKVSAWISQQNTRLWIAALFVFLLALVEWEIYYQVTSITSTMPIPWLDHRETLLDSIYTILVIFGLLGLASSKLPVFKQVSSIGAKSFGIYLTHAIAIEYTARLVYRFFPQLLGYQIILLPLLIFVGLAIPLLLMYLVNMLPDRKVYTYLFG
jgi:probable poly-beta-1,6-N-acetyl-D-glucosamine export protein